MPFWLVYYMLHLKHASESCTGAKSLFPLLNSNMDFDIPINVRCILCFKHLSFALDCQNWALGGTWDSQRHLLANYGTDTLKGQDRDQSWQLTSWTVAALLATNVRCFCAMWSCAIILFSRLYPDWFLVRRLSFGGLNGMKLVFLPLYMG